MPAPGLFSEECLIPTCLQLVSLWGRAHCGEFIQCEVVKIVVTDHSEWLGHGGGTLKSIVKG